MTAEDRPKPDPSLDRTLADALTGPTAPLDLAGGFEVRYERRDLLGTGGMGVVELYRDRHMGREVALKSVQPESGPASGQSARARFQREARVQAQLDHPAIVPIYDLGVRPDGTEFFTMKHVRGRTLADLLAQHRRDGSDLPARRPLLGAFGTVCLAVDYAHARGVVHRDLKPANLMLGDFGEVYVLDWGLARLEETIESEPAATEPVAPIDFPATDRTVDGAILGTVGYVPPEVLGGRRGDVRGDVYALGAILYEILTLEPLHLGASFAALATSTMEGGRLALHDSNAPPIPPELEVVCRQATERDAAARTSGARALHDAVERFLSGDRDLELRRAEAARRADSAVRHADRAAAPGASLDDRRRALQEVGRALALDPDNAVARSVLVRLLTTPPAELPDEAAAEVTQLHHDDLRASARNAVPTYLAVMAVMLLGTLLGIGPSSIRLGLLALFTAGAVTSFVSSRLARLPVWVLPVLLTMTTAGYASLSVVLGPFLLVPMLIVSNAVGFSFYPWATRWTTIVAIGATGLLTPVLLEWVGVLPRSYRFEDGALLVVPRFVVLSPVVTQTLLVGGSLVTLLVAVRYASSFLELVADARRRLVLHTWQLRQLV